MNLLIPIKRAPVIRLARVQETSSGKTWIFDFIDPVHKMGQSIIFPKSGHPGALEAAYEALWKRWSDALKERDWKAGNA